MGTTPTGQPSLFKLGIYCRGECFILWSADRLHLNHKMKITESDPLWGAGKEYSFFTSAFLGDSDIQQSLRTPGLRVLLVVPHLT